MPGDNIAKREVLEHYGAVAIVAMDDDGKFVMVYQYRHTYGRRIWELPAGSVDAGESAEAAAARECEEEIALAPGRVQRIVGLYPTPGYCDEEMIYFRVSDLHPPAPGSPHKPDEDEDIYVQAFTISEAKALATRGEIVDLKTAYGLTLL